VISGSGQPTTLDYSSLPDLHWSLVRQWAAHHGRTFVATARNSADCVE